VNVRPFLESDRAILAEIHAQAAYGFPFPENIEEYVVAADGAGFPVMAAGAKLIPEVTLICAPGGSTHPLIKLKAIALLHESIRDKLIAKGYSEAIATVPPNLVAYQRHLQRHFRWQHESWPVFRVRDWKGGS
jgi:hypothetical protein